MSIPLVARAISSAYGLYISLCFLFRIIIIIKCQPNFIEINKVAKAAVIAVVVHLLCKILWFAEQRGFKFFKRHCISYLGDKNNFINHL